MADTDGGLHRPSESRTLWLRHKFREAVLTVQRHIAGARSLADAADKAGSSADAAALRRRACSFGQLEQACEPPARTDPHRPKFHLMPARPRRLARTCVAWAPRSDTDLLTRCSH